MATRGRPRKQLPGAAELAAQGMTSIQIAAALGVCQQTVENWARRDGVKLTAAPRGGLAHVTKTDAPPRFCECCGKADISSRPRNTKYCLPCRNSGLVMLVAHKAVGLVNTMVKAGLLVRPTELTCVDCGKPAECYDHRDYLKPMDVEPVCKQCNADRGSAANKFPWLDADARLRAQQPA